MELNDYHEMSSNRATKGTGVNKTRKETFSTFGMFTILVVAFLHAMFAVTTKLCDRVSQKNMSHSKL